ncbi:MarR family winged helix-turn-helix transcriptional regulator [Geomicrobium sp. JCM 19039]|uniref:MarR family winged helix-turn-helix transcriptional regulator n=1 Tax=Geomicrobium sp. JCM 19039 TaxID=1460636 RepID=UPI00045F1FA0|nr:MarR family transcriptional regulator [Geomicrobium sp. JCM 19039]GAK10639.1 transcriptional regulator, MarR family [Geomicrobium sp. JCM 19039]
MDHTSTHDRRLAILLWFRLARFYNQSIKASNKHLEQWQLTTAQFDLLVQVGAHQPVTQQHLAEKLLVTKGNITHLVKKMEERGLIMRQQDWKTKYLSLTDEGTTFYEEVVPQQEQFQIDQFAELDTADQKELLRLLNILHKQGEN